MWTTKFTPLCDVQSYQAQSLLRDHASLRHVNYGSPLDGVISQMEQYLQFRVP